MDMNGVNIRKWDGKGINLHTDNCTTYKMSLIAGPLFDTSGKMYMSMPHILKKNMAVTPYLEIDLKSYVIHNKVSIILTFAYVTLLIQMPMFLLN